VIAGDGTADVLGANFTGWDSFPTNASLEFSVVGGIWQPENRSFAFEPGFKVPQSEARPRANCGEHFRVDQYMTKAEPPERTLVRGRGRCLAHVDLSCIRFYQQCLRNSDAQKACKSWEQDRIIPRCSWAVL